MFRVQGFGFVFDNVGTLRRARGEIAKLIRGPEGLLQESGSGYGCLWVAWGLNTLAQRWLTFLYTAGLYITKKVKGYLPSP